MGVQLQIDEQRVGYVVWIDPENNPHFEIFGKQAGLIEILGLEQFARQKIEDLKNDKMMRGDALTHEVGKATQATLNTLEKLVKNVAESSRLMNDLCLKLASVIKPQPVEEKQGE